MRDTAEVEIFAAPNAADRGLCALADLAAAAAGSNYRVVGGHMVHLLGRLYPTDTAARVTADAGAGMDTVAAADATFHTALLARGYRPVTGNHYEVPSPCPWTYWFPAPAVADSNASTTPDMASTSSSARPSHTVRDTLCVHVVRCVHASHAVHASATA